MKKQYQNINLTCLFQQVEELSSDQCLSGLFSRNTDGTFSFEEVIPKVRDVRNAKLFDGQYISMVRMKNGKLQIHFKVIESIDDPRKLAQQIFNEVTKALTQIS